MTNQTLKTSTSLSCIFTVACLTFLIGNILLNNLLGTMINVYATWAFISGGMIFGILLLKEMYIDKCWSDKPKLEKVE